MSKLDHYFALNYHRRLYQDDEDDWIVEIDDLPGCVADGKTPDEAVENSRQAMQVWMESRLSSGLDIPEPSIADSGLRRRRWRRARVGSVYPLWSDGL
jgi:predicted RNase H-like HicB family nuclease